MPARKYWLNLTPGATVPVNADPKTTSSSTGRINVKNAASRSRTNEQQLDADPAQPDRQHPGRPVLDVDLAHCSPTIPR